MATDSSHPPPGHDRFFGREAQIQRLREILAEGDGRVVTLVGMGGAGKTTLALHFATQLAGRCPERAYIVDLSEARTGEDLLRAMAATLDLSLTDRAPARQIGWALASRGPVLVVLDRFEGALHEAEATLGVWVPRAPEARFLVTSRARLGVEGEHVVEVGPLDPDDGARMLLTRAGLPLGDGALLRGARQFVKQLDYIPLAIELAAAWLRRTPLEARVDAVLGGQTGQVHAPLSPLDHPALARALETSWATLPPWARLALAQASVFQGGFTLDLAERILDLSGLDDAPWPVDAVQTLVDHSLVQANADPQGAIRFALLDTVSGWARRRLEDPAAVLDPQRRPLTGPAARAALRSRHATALAAYGAPPALRALETHGGSTRRAALLAETDNLRVALESALEGGASPEGAAPIAPEIAPKITPEIAADLAMALGEIAFLRGPFAPGLAALDRAAALPGQPAHQLGRLAVSQARLLVVMGRPDEVGETLERAIRHARSVGDRAVEATALVLMGVSQRGRGRLQEALSTLEAANALARAQEDRVLQGYASGNLGVACRRAGDEAAAERWISGAIALAREAGDRRREGLWTGYLAGILASTRSFDEVSAMFYLAIAILREVGDRHHEGLYLGNLGIELRIQGRLAEGRAVSEQGLKVARQMGAPAAEASCLINLGLIAMRQGDLGGARRAIERSIALYRESGERVKLDIARGYLGELLLELGEHRPAEDHLRACVRACDAIGHPAGGSFRGPLALLCAREGRLDEASALLDEADQRVEGAVETDALRCRRAQVAALAGQTGLAASILAEVRARAVATGAPPTSDLGAALAAAARTAEAQTG